MAKRRVLARLDSDPEGFGPTIALALLRPLAAAIGTSPRVLLYLFTSKDGLIRALLARARTEQLELLASASLNREATLADVAAVVWQWLVAEDHHPLVTLWLEGYARSLVEPDGPWTDFARRSVEDWLAVLSPLRDRDGRGHPRPRRPARSPPRPAGHRGSHPNHHGGCPRRARSPGTG